MLKRIFDIVFSMAGLLVLAPLFVLIALVVKMDSKGPVFYRQVRVGQYGKKFKIHKFRTMVVDAEFMGLHITVEGDSRVTHVGSFLRKYKLDELPQLIDVLVGDMSLVGPRPQVPRYVEHYPSDIRDAVLSIRPGITDIASIEFRSEDVILAGYSNPDQGYIEEILPVKLGYHVDYVNCRNFITDILIIFKTLRAIVRPRQASATKRSYS